jgi:hypothetical protein
MREGASFDTAAARVTKKYLAICLVAMIPGCGAKSPNRAMPANQSAVNAARGRVPGNVLAYLAALETLELDPHRYESYERYYSVVCGKMSDWLTRFDDPYALRTLFWTGYAIGHANLNLDNSQDKLQWIEPHFESLNLILYRLAEIRTSDAARVLVALWSDPKAGWDAGSAEAACDAVVKCGKPTLPFLRQKEIELHQKKRGAPPASIACRLMKLIESGATTGL